jgi:5'-3' exonuclease
MTTTALVDGDALVYRCGFAAEKTHYLVWDAEGKAMFPDNHRTAKEWAGKDGLIWSRKEYEPLENCLQMVKSSLENTLRVLGADDYRIYLTGKRNFRDDIYPDYKANRDGATRPKYYRDIREYLVQQWRALVVDGIEADDAVGIASSTPGSVVVAVDKDLDQIPGRHYNWTSGEAYTVDAQGGTLFFYQQLLSGDPTDNISGLAGIGPVKSAKLVAGCSRPVELATLVYGLYRDALGHPPDEVIDRNASLLWIWRKENDKHPFWRHLGREPV